MVKVVELIPTLNTGGAESMIRDYCLLLNREIIDVKVVVMAERMNSAIEKHLSDECVDVVYLGECIYPGEKALNIFQKVVRFIGRYTCFRKIVNEFKPDVIHCHLHVGNYFKFIPLKKLKCRLILTVHNVTHRYFDKTGKDKAKYREYKEVYRLIHRHGMQLVALHNSMNEELRDFFDTDNVITVYNGIDIARFDPCLYDSNTVRSKIGLKDTSFVIGNVGRLHEQKNHELILKIFRKVKEAISDSKLILIGSGELEQTIRSSIEEYGLTDDVMMLSNRDDVPELMAAMDVFLFPSLWEGFGNVLIEAQCMGLPCVISQVIPNDVVISNGIRVCDLDSSTDEWSKKVIECKDISVKTDEASKKEFDIRNSVRRLEKIYCGE